MEQVKTFFEWTAAVPSVYQSLVEVFGRNSEVIKSISGLEATLIVASQLIERSECWCFRYDSIGKMLFYLKSAVYEAELTIDEFKSQRRRAENIPGELINNFKNWATGFDKKVISAQGNLDRFSDQLEKICNSHEIPQNPKKFNKPITVSRPPDVLYGRDKELDVAINILGIPRSGLNAGKSSRCAESKRKIPVLPIVGMGGVGKTTLSQIIYKDKRVQSYFDLKIWICVTEKFDLERMLKEIIQCATRKVCDFTNLNLLQKKLKKAVKSKRVLLALDDIWSAEWQQLLGPMNKASEESAIILTTRSVENFNCTEGNMTLLEPISLMGLEEEIYWKFFKRCAGLKVDLRNYSELEPIAREICVRLKGLPLAAKTLGSALSERIDRQHWITIRDSEMWKVKQGEDGMMHVLLLSYLHLPSVELKKCFSFCSVFSKDHEFHPFELAKFWIMNRLIPIQENLKSMEDLALDYFYDLEKRGFFHRSAASTKYVMHDLMHDICRFLKGDECYCLEDEAFANIPPNMHYVSVCRTKLLNAETLRKLHKLEKLHTLLVAPNYRGIDWEFPHAFISLCAELTSIRRLSLSYCGIMEIPENIGNLKCLKYLDISNNKELKKLPQSFCNLYDLEFLDMHGCNEFLGDLGFPSGCDKLRGLKYFTPPIHVVTSLTHIPSLFGAMQFYDLTYKVENNGRNKIENLKLLTGVRGFLEIEGLQNVSSKKAAEEAGLNKQEQLDKLHLKWAYEVHCHASANNEIQKEVLEGLRPHSNLEKLEICNYNGSDLPPSWMGKDDLPKLKIVMFTYCLNFEQNCLTITLLHYCTKHIRLPQAGKSCGLLAARPSSKIEVYLDRLSSPTEIRLPLSIKLLGLTDCGELLSSIPWYLKNLTSLEVLYICDCPNIVAIPNEVMWTLPSLRCLDVSYCPNLVSLGDEEFLESIKFTISECPNRQITRGGNPNGRQLSADALPAAAPSSSGTTPLMPLIDQTPTIAQGATAAAAPSAPATTPSLRIMPSVETQTTDDPSSSNPRKRKAGAQN